MGDDTGALGVAPGSPTVSLVEATAAQRPLLEHLLQLYLHDFSERVPRDSPWGEVDEDGLFAYPPTLDPYWRESGRAAL
jgi:hypothetical protein